MIPWIDWHQDILWTLQERRQIPDVPGLLQAGLRAVVGAVFPLRSWAGSTTPTGDLLAYTLRALDLYWSWAEETPDLVVRTSWDDLKMEAPTLQLILGVEGGYMISDCWTVRTLYRQGVRVLGLTWNVDNALAASCKTEKDYGLTALGRTVVEEALSLGILVDLAHASPRTRQDILDAFPDVPPFFSHGGILPHLRDPRNLSYAEADRIAERGGLMGIGLGTLFLEEAFPLPRRRVVDRVAELLQRYPEHLALGTDFFGLSPTDSEITGLRRAPDMPRFFQELAERVGEDAVRNLAYRNSLRYLRRWTT